MGREGRLGSRGLVGDRNELPPTSDRRKDNVGKRKSVFTNEEWANLKRMLGDHTTVMMAVDILGGSDLGQEADMYRAYFLLTEHRIVSPTEGNPRVSTVNYYWRLTERLKQDILSLQPWLNANKGRTKDPADFAELGKPRPRPVGNRYLHLKQKR